MLRLILRGLGTRKLRSALTAVAILLGVAMVSGTYVLTDQINGAFDEIFEKSNVGTDVVLSRQTEFDSSQDQAGPLPESLVERVRRVPGVATASGDIIATGNLVVDGDVVESQGPALVVSVPPAPFNNNEIVAGRFPQRSGEAAVDKGVADREDLRVGQRIGLATQIGEEPITISGIFKFAAADIGGATIVGLTLEDAQRWFNRIGQVSTIEVAAESGVSDQELTRRIRAVMPSYVKVETGQQNAQEQASNINDDIGGFLTPALLAFAGVAILVGAFIIFNTFSITVAQRTRELAMLRTIGATRRQVMWSVIGEAFVIGIVAAVAGLLLGLGFAALLNVLFDAVGFGLPTTGVVLKGRTVVVSLLVGVVVTVIAATLPAMRATRVPPIAALREGAQLPPSRFSRGWIAITLRVIVLVLGLYFLVAGLFGSGSAQSRLISMAIGAVLIFVFVGMVARYAVPGMARAIGWPLERMGRAAGRLARENASRNPGRTAATSAALMIGVGLVAFVTIFAQGLKESFGNAIDKTAKGDLIITGQNFENLPPASADAVALTPGISAVAAVGFTEVKINRGGTDFLNAVNPVQAAQVISFDWQGGGTDALLDQLGAGGAVIEKNFAESHDLSVGDSFLVTTNERRRARFRVLGIYKDPQLFTGFTVSQRAYDALVTDPDVGVILAKFAPGADPEATQRAVEESLRRFPAAEVRSNAEYKDEVEGLVDQLLYVLYALLLFSVIISLFGIVNTLVLSVFERTREIGMLRAIGITRGQLRRTIRYESVITATIGGVLGIVVGVFFGWLMARSLEDEGIVFAVPYVQLLIFLVLAVLAGVLAAILPARRAARLNPLEALHYE